MNLHRREKLLNVVRYPYRKPTQVDEKPVPQTDTGRREENSKTNGRTLVKELGKMTP